MSRRPVPPLSHDFDRQGARVAAPDPLAVQLTLEELVRAAGFRFLGAAPQRGAVVIVDGRAYG